MPYPRGHLLSASVKKALAPFKKQPPPLLPKERGIKGVRSPYNLIIISLL